MKRRDNLNLKFPVLAILFLDHDLGVVLDFRCSEACQQAFAGTCFANECPERDYASDDARDRCKNQIRDGGELVSSEVCAKSCKLTTTMEEAECGRPDFSGACEEDFLKRCLEGDQCPDRDYNTDESQNECKNMIKDGWGGLKKGAHIRKVPI